MKMISVSYKELFEIMQALEFKLDAERKKNRDEMVEDGSIDFGHDVAFLEEILEGAKLSLSNWHALPSAPR